MSQPQIPKLPEVFLEAAAAGDLGCEVAYAALQVTPSFCAQIQSIQKLCIENALNSVHVTGGPDRWGPTEVSTNVYTGAGRELVINSRTFHFISDTYRAFVTAEVSIDEFLEAMRTSDGQPFYFSKQIGHLQDLVEQDAESEQDAAGSGDSFSL